MSLATLPSGLPVHYMQIQGQNGRIVQQGMFAFSTTDANGLLAVRMRVVECVIITPMGTVATDETVSGPAHTAGTGKIVVDGTGTIQINRTGAAKTSGLVCSYIVIGY